jgi:hypothetical protein
MQINSASLLAAQQVRTPAQAAPRAAAKPSDELFEPLFGKTETKAAPAAQPSTVTDAKPQAFARPGSQIDIRV